MRHLLKNGQKKSLESTQQSMKKNVSCYLAKAFIKNVYTESRMSKNISEKKDIQNEILTIFFYASTLFYVPIINDIKNIKRTLRGGKWRIGIMA